MYVWHFLTTDRSCYWFRHTDNNIISADLYQSVSAVKSSFSFSLAATLCPSVSFRSLNIRSWSAASCLQHSLCPITNITHSHRHAPYAIQLQSNRQLWKSKGTVHSENVYMSNSFIIFSANMHDSVSCMCPGAKLWLQSVWKGVQALVHPVHTPPHPLGHTALPVPVLRQAVPSEVRHEETHLHTHRWVSTAIGNDLYCSNGSNSYSSGVPPQVRNHTCARCAAKDLAKAPTSLPTAESTAATGRSAAPGVSTTSSAGLTCSATKRLSVAMEKYMLKTESRKRWSHVKTGWNGTCK